MWGGSLVAASCRAAAPLELLEANISLALSRMTSYPRFLQARAAPLALLESLEFEV